jgi:pilus assembly protein Flp/PilA
MLALITSMALVVRSAAARVSTDERGQTAAEYIGIILVVAAIVGALVGFGSDIATAIKNGITSAVRSVAG